jgi:hypothetical protein
MSFVLVPKLGEDLQINAWNWRPTLELLRRQNLISDEDYERMGTQGAGGQVDAGLACRIAEVVERKFALMKAGERMLADLTVTAKPKTDWILTAETKLNEVEAPEMYSASYDWLVLFAEFCRRSGGFEIF